jgi:hypothetical protein
MAKGSSVAETFLDAGHRVRGLTRDPSKPAAQEWVKKGVEMIKGDLNDLETLTSAFRDANIIFGNTDSWGIIWDPATQKQAETSGKNVSEMMYEIEVQQIKNMAAAANATILTLDRFILSSLPAAKRLSKGKYTHMYHFDSKADASQWLIDSQPELAKKTSFVWMPWYANNWKVIPPMKPVEVR